MFAIGLEKDLNRGKPALIFDLTDLGFEEN